MKDLKQEQLLVYVVEWCLLKYIFFKLYLSWNILNNPSSYLHLQKAFAMIKSVIVSEIKQCSLLKIENNSSWVNFTQFREKTHLLPFELIFVSWNWRVYMYVKFDIKMKSQNDIKRVQYFLNRPYKTFRMH